MNAALHYSIDSPYFSINNEGKISVHQRLDADQNQEGFYFYRFNVTARDYGYPERLLGTALVKFLI